VLTPSTTAAYSSAVPQLSFAASGEGPYAVPSRLASVSLLFLTAIQLNALSP
jgi:hypothetical protein